MNFGRRWTFTLIALVIALVIGGYSWFTSKGSEECKPVRDMLEFSQKQGQLISSKSSDSDQGVPTVAEDTVYQQWADGMAQRAEKVTDPELAQKAVDLADLTTQFVTKLPRMRSEAENRAPGAPTPPVAFEMAVLNQKITDRTEELAKACPA